MKSLRSGMNFNLFPFNFYYQPRQSFHFILFFSIVCNGGIIINKTFDMYKYPTREVTIIKSRTRVRKKLWKYSENKSRQRNLNTISCSFVRKYHNRRNQYCNDLVKCISILLFILITRASRKDFIKRYPPVSRGGGGEGRC